MCVGICTVAYNCCNRKTQRYNKITVRFVRMCVHVRLGVCVYVCVCVFMCVYVCMCVYVYV